MEKKTGNLNELEYLMRGLRAILPQLSIPHVFIIKITVYVTITII